MKFRPLHDRVVVSRLEEDTKTAGGIIIPDTVKEKPMQGEIVAVGPGARDESGKIVPLDVKAGDRVLFGKWSGTEVKIDGEDLLIMKESDILGVIEGKRQDQGRRLSPHDADPPINSGVAHTWPPKTSNSLKTRASACCAASTSSPTP